MIPPLTELVDLMKIFVFGADQSSGNVDRIEALLIEHFRNSDDFEELLFSVSLFSPGGGTHLVDERELANEFKALINRLEQT